MNDIKFGNNRMYLLHSQEKIDEYTSLFQSQFEYVQSKEFKSILEQTFRNIFRQDVEITNCKAIEDIDKDGFTIYKIDYELTNAATGLSNGEFSITIKPNASLEGQYLSLQFNGDSIGRKPSETIIPECHYILKSINIPIFIRNWLSLICWND